MFKDVFVFLLSQVAVKIIDKTQLNSSSLQKVSVLFICISVWRKGTEGVITGREAEGFPLTWE